MAVEVEHVRDEERMLGGDVVWWIVLLVFSLPMVLLGVAKAPDLGGFVLMIVGGILAGVAFAQVMLRLPYFTHRLFASFVILTVVTLVVIGIAFLFGMALPVPTAPPDVMYKPPVSGG
jgi:hypothetical protein